ncbi:hypothetical protein K8I31_17175, partial [bacterium]|nr:hypothetical protein [bacterium]
LSECDDNEAYCLANAGKSYALYFPKGGDVLLTLAENIRIANVRWFNLESRQYLPSTKADIVDGAVRLRLPGADESWFVLVECR